MRRSGSVRSKSLNGVPIEDWVRGLTDKSINLSVRVEGDDILIGGNFDSIDEADE